MVAIDAAWRTAGVVRTIVVTLLSKCTYYITSKTALVKVKFPNQSFISIWNSLKHKIPLGQCVNACLDVLYHSCSIHTADARMLNIPDVRYTPACSDMHFGPRPNIRQPVFFSVNLILSHVMNAWFVIHSLLHIFCHHLCVCIIT